MNESVWIWINSNVSRGVIFYSTTFSFVVFHTVTQNAGDTYEISCLG